MKFLIFFALAFATVSAKDLHSLSIEDPALEKKSRITNGKRATLGQFKYMVGLALEVESYTVWCGGSLIDAEWVLSAAHCTVSASSIKVYLGATNRLKANKCYNVKQKDIFTYPIYNEAALKNDISLIRIPKTNASSNIGFVKIPNNDNNKYLGDSVVITGWGRTSDNDTTVTKYLQYGIVKVSPGNICFERYGLKFTDDLKICVATPHKVSTCKGDSGGPLVLEGQNLLIGVDSSGSKRGCTEKAPIMFTRVSAFLHWIMVRTGIHH